MPAAGAVFGAQLARDHDYSGHVLCLDQARQRHFLDFLDISESDQFQILFQDRRAQRPKIGRIVILSVHKITDIVILRMIIDLSFKGDSENSVSRAQLSVETPLSKSRRWLHGSQSRSFSCNASGESDVCSVRKSASIATSVRTGARKIQAQRFFSSS